MFGVILARIFPVFSRIPTEYGELGSFSLYSIQMLENAGKTLDFIVTGRT